MSAAATTAWPARAAFASAPARRSSDRAHTRGRAPVVVTRASGAPLRGSRSASAATAKAPRTTRRVSRPIVRPGRPRAPRRRCPTRAASRGSLSAAARAAGAAAGADSPRGAPRGDVSASSVGLVDAPETESETKSTSPRARGVAEKRTPRHRQAAASTGRATRRAPFARRRTRRDDTRSDPEWNDQRRSRADRQARGRESRASPGDGGRRRVLRRIPSEETFSALDRASSLSSTPRSRTRRDATRRLDAAAARFAALHPGAPTADKDVDAQEVRCVELAEGDAVVRVGVDGRVSLFRRRKDAAAAETRETRDPDRGAESRKSPPMATSCWSLRPFSVVPTPTSSAR